jgi:hypothetical protein
MLAHWPAYLAHVATELAPRFADAHTTQICHDIARRVDAASTRVLHALPPAADPPPRPPVDEHAQVLEVMARYRETSPQMVLFGTLLRDALPSG